jgi:hypothetical protein
MAHAVRDWWCADAPNADHRHYLRDEADVVIAKLRPLLNGHRLGATVRALFILTVEHAGRLLKAEETGCNCYAEPKQGLYKCESNREHAATTTVEQ